MIENKKEAHKTKCCICGNTFITRAWIEQEGVLKGEKIIESCFCSRKCRIKFKQLVKQNG